MMTDRIHRAKVRLNPRDLMRAIGAPDSVDLRRVIVTDDPEAVWLIIEHPALEASFPDCEVPILNAEQAETVFADITASDHYL